MNIGITICKNKEFKNCYLVNIISDNLMISLEFNEPTGWSVSHRDIWNYSKYGFEKIVDKKEADFLLEEAMLSMIAKFNKIKDEKMIEEIIK